MPLLSPYELKNLLPLPSKQQKFILSAQTTIQNLLSGRDPRIAIITGPCSIHDRVATLEYAHKFKKLAQSVMESCFLVMRVYVEKPRTSTGWKGYLYDPYLDGSYDIRAGLVATRELLLELASLEIPAAAEFVDPLATPYFSDLISWGFIGARTSASQPHRQLASLLNFPIGFKNATDGNIDDAIHGVIASMTPHTFLHMNEDGKITSTQSLGNPHTHIVLRGAYESTNYDAKSVAHALQKMHIAEVSTRLLIDCSHGNCQKVHEKQKQAFHAVIEQIKAGNQQILGVMLESHLQSGNQSLNFPLQYAVSITDPCIDWATTEELIFKAHALLEKSLQLN
jgi:3-deoxy-7-phosphoheptulonate synthase